MDKLVSICIPTHNGEKYLQQALDSVIKQTYKNIEVIISDDASRDQTVYICQKFQNEVSFPVKIVNHKPSGIGANWNNSIEHSNGEFIKLLFQDDILESNCIQTMMMFLVKHKLDMVASKRTIIDERSVNVTTGSFFEDYGDLQKRAGFGVENFGILSKYSLNKLNFGFVFSANMVGEPCVTLFTRRLYNKVGPFNITLKQSLDCEYWIRVLGKYKIGIIEEKLVKFRVHSEQTSHVNSLLKVDETEVINKKFYEILLFHTNTNIIKSYYLEKYPFFKKINLLKNQLIKKK